MSRALRGSGFQRNQTAAFSRVATNSLKVRPFVTLCPFGLSLPLLTSVCRIKVCVVVLLATGKPNEIARARVSHWVGHARLNNALASRSVPVQTIHVTPCVVVTHASIIPAPPTYLRTNRRSVYAREPRCGATLPRSSRGSWPTASRETSPHKAEPITWSRLSARLSLGEQYCHATWSHWTRNR